MNDTSKEKVIDINPEKIKKVEEYVSNLISTIFKELTRLFGKLNYFNKFLRFWKNFKFGNLKNFNSNIF
jgi:hypothetical protein